jgi:TRAP-type C4-dicarboxylate transport system permease small subunit
MMQIVWRYLLQHSLSWSEELARYLFVWVIALGAALALKSNSHIKLDLVVELLPRRMQLPLLWIGRVAMIVVWVVLAFATLDLLPVVNLQKSPALGLPMSWPYLSVLVGALLMLVFTLLDCIGHVKGSRLAPSKEDAGEDSR